MFKEFLEKIEEWTLQKEEELAKKCEFPVSQIDKQLEVLNKKKAELKAKCEEQIAEFDKFIERLEKIKKESKCS